MPQKQRVEDLKPFGNCLSSLKRISSDTILQVYYFYYDLLKVPLDLAMDGATDEESKPRTVKAPRGVRINSNVSQPFVYRFDTIDVNFFICINSVELLFIFSNLPFV